MNKTLGTIILIAFIVIMIPLGVRDFVTNHYPAFESSYAALNNFNEALEVSTFHAITQDPFMAITYFLTEGWFGWGFAINVILAAACIFLCFLLLTRYTKKIQRITITCIILMLTPMFISVFTGIRSMAWYLIIILGAAYTAERKQYKLMLLLLILLGFGNFILFFATSMILFLLISFKQPKQYWLFFIIPLLWTLFLKIVINGYSIVSLITPEFGYLTNIFYVFGSTGTTFFIFINGLFGLYLFSEKSRKNNMIITIALALFVLALFYPSIAVLFTVVFAFFAGIAIQFFDEREWHLSNFKSITMILIFCALIFPAAVFIGEIIDAEPSDERILTYDELTDVVLASPENAERITYFTGLKTVSFSEVDQELIETRDLDQFITFLSQYDITEIYLDDATIDAFFKSDDDHGSLLLLQNSESFFITHNDNVATIWKLNSNLYNGR